MIHKKSSYHCVKWDDSFWHDEVKDIVKVFSEQEISGIDMRPHL